MPRELTGYSKHPLPTRQEKTTHEHHQMLNTEMRLIIFFAAKDGKLPGSIPGGSREIQRGDGFAEVDTIALIKY